jgi:MinD-like ATPase involved in chromosome partitioning or flagellar assembly
MFRRRKPAIPAGAAARAEAPVAVPIGELARALRGLGEAGRRITVIGTARNVGTTYTAIGLARALSQSARAVLVDLALGAPNLSVMSVHPDAPGIAELVRGTASFGQIITRDKFSRTHIVATGQVGSDRMAIMSSPKLAATLEALARTYDHVVIDAGAISEAAVNSFARLAPRAVLVASDLTHPDTVAARERLAGAGFTDVTLFLSTPRGPEAVAA